MKIELTKTKLLSLNAGIKQAGDIPDFKLAWAMNRTAVKIKPEIEAIKKTLEYSGKFLEYIEACKICKKDDSEYQKLDEKYDDVKLERIKFEKDCKENFDKEKIEVEVFTVPFSYIENEMSKQAKDMLTKNILECLEPIIQV